jgi:hypothetical protein
VNGAYTADCASCHTVHGDIAEIHTTDASQACVDCHETADVREIHASTPGDATTSCATCHNATVVLPSSTECVECHAGESPPDPNHYLGTETTHTATPADSTCADCHYLEMYPEHVDKPTSTTGAGDPVTCVVCHETAVDAFAVAWDSGPCSTCHPTKHQGIEPGGVAHVSARAECGGSGCHPVGDVSDVHDATPTYTDGSGDAGAPAEIFADGFEGGDLSAWSDTTYFVASQGAARTGSWGAHQTSTSLSRLEVAVDTDGRANVTLEFWLRGSSATESSDWVRAFFRAQDGTWRQIWGKTLEDRRTTWERVVVAIDEGAFGPFGPNTAFRIDADVSYSNEYQDIDDVLLSADPIAAPEPPPPGGSDGTGCERCHSQSQVPTTTDCYVCHPGATPGHHESHNTAGVIPNGCDGCHFAYLDDEHLSLGYECDVCHASLDGVVQEAIAAGDRDCRTCHPDGHYRRNQQEVEFNPYNGSMHRVNASLPGMRDSFVVDGNTYSWSLPSASSFLQSGWTYDSIVTCEDCHTYSGGSGPHGAQMKVNVDPNYTVAYGDGVLDKNSSVGMQSGLLCAKCHDLVSGESWSNEAHKEHDDRGFYEGGRCISCHIAVPHGWARPRMLGSTTDPAPYTVAANGLYRFTLKSYSPGNWDDRDCEAACDDHHDEPVNNPWPGTVAPPPVTGTLSGRVTDEGDAGVPGATVSVADGPSTQTDSSGYYTLALEVGAHSVTASKPGYTSQTLSATILEDQTTTLDFTLAISPISTGGLSGTVTNYRGYRISGATVTLGTHSTTTDDYGRYSFTDVDEGTYTLAVRAYRYRDWTGSVTIVAGQTVTRDVQMDSYYRRHD